MATPSTPEFWLRGPVEGVHPALMPAAHAFLQTLEDVERAAADLSNEQLWLSPGGAASIGFHLMHLSGSTDQAPDVRARRVAERRTESRLQSRVDPAAGRCLVSPRGPAAIVRRRDGAAAGDAAVVDT